MFVTFTLLVFVVWTQTQTTPYVWWYYCWMRKSATLCYHIKKGLWPFEVLFLHSAPWTWSLQLSKHKHCSWGQALTCSPMADYKVLFCSRCFLCGVWDRCPRQVLKECGRMTSEACFQIQNSSTTHPLWDIGWDKIKNCVDRCEERSSKSQQQHRMKTGYDCKRGSNLRRP